MIEKIKIPKKIYEFMAEKVCSFISDYANNRINEKKEKDIGKSKMMLEREIRHDLDALESEINGVEAIVYQSMRLYESTIKRLSDEKYNLNINNLNVYKIDINSSSINMMDINNDIFLKQYISQIINEEMSKLFQIKCDEQLYITRQEEIKSNYKRSIRDIVEEGEKRLRSLREED